MVGFAATMMVSLLIGVQATVWGIAELACRSAANHALQVSRVRGGTAATGEADAATVLAQISGSLVQTPAIGAQRGDATTTVTVRGSAIRVVPWISLPVGSTMTAPTEGLTPTP